MDWMKYSKAKLKEKEIDEVLLLKERFFVDEKKTIEAIRDLSLRIEWKDFLETLEKNLYKEFEEI